MAKRYGQNLRSTYLAPLTVPYFSSTFEAYRPWYGTFFCVPYLQSIWLNNYPLMTYAMRPMLTCFCLYLIRIIPKDMLKAAFLKRVN